MKRMTPRLNVLSLMVGVLVVQMGALTPTALAVETFDYPELSVTPRASDRLEMESKQEDSRKLTSYIPLQISAATTLVAGFVQNSNTDPAKDAQGNSPLAGMIVGGAWLGLTAVLMFTDEPYTNAWKEIGPMPHKSVREQLTRERVAEEAIQRRGRLARTVKWLSFASNAFAGAYMLGNGNDKAKAFDGIALVTALAPVIFPSHWQEVAEDQTEYKKRIYAPVASGAILKAPGENGYAPGLILALRF